MSPIPGDLTPDARLAAIEEALSEANGTQSDPALAALDTAAQRDPVFAATLASRLQFGGRKAEAEQVYRAMIPAWPRGHGIAPYNNLAVLACEREDYDQAWQWARMALAEDPQQALEMTYNLAKSVQFAGVAEVFWKAIDAAQALDPANLRIWSARFVEDSFRTMPETSPARAPIGPAPVPRIRPRDSTPDIQRPGHILLVGRDFSNVASFNRLYGPFRDLPRQGYRVEGLSIRDDFDPDRSHLPELTCHSVPERDPKAIETAVRRINPDVVIDLVSHGQPEAFLAYAARPAPLILGWAGNGVTSGTYAYDAFLTDDALSPPGADRHYTERLVRLPSSCITVQPYAQYPTPHDNRLPCDRKGHTTFGVYHRLSKITPEAIALWAEILGRVPGSRLILKTAFLDRPTNRERMLGQFARRNIDDRRIDILPMTGALDHCRVVMDTDITLTTFPEQGIVTDFDHLWMGVPAIAYEVDTRPCARLSAALTKAAGAPFLTTHSPQAYVDLAVDLASDRGYLALARRSYRSNLEKAGFTDHARTAAAMSQAIDGLWAEMLQAPDKPTRNETPV